MNDIKIFVSRRLDLNSVIIPNPIYVPIICGAVYASQMNNLQGDNLGDNISSTMAFVIIEDTLFLQISVLKRIVNAK